LQGDRPPAMVLVVLHMWHFVGNKLLATKNAKRILPNQKAAVTVRRYRPEPKGSHGLL
jgi:hypothetical protein